MSGRGRRGEEEGEEEEEECLAGAECLFMFGCFAIGRRDERKGGRGGGPPAEEGSLPGPNSLSCHCVRNLD